MADRVTPEPSTPSTEVCAECGAVVDRLSWWKHDDWHKSVDGRIEAAQAGEW